MIWYFMIFQQIMFYSVLLHRVFSYFEKVYIYMGMYYGKCSKTCHKGPLRWEDTLYSKTCIQGTLWWEDTVYAVKPVFKGHSDERTPSMQ